MHSYRDLKTILQKPQQQRSKEELQDVENIISNHQFFKKNIKSREHCEQIVQLMHFEECQEFQNVINYGEKGDKFYIILKGLVSIKIPNPAIGDWRNQRAKYENLLKWKNTYFEHLKDRAIKKKFLQKLDTHLETMNY